MFMLTMSWSLCLVPNTDQAPAQLSSYPTFHILKAFLDLLQVTINGAVCSCKPTTPPFVMRLFWSSDIVIFNSF